MPTLRAGGPRSSQMSGVTIPDLMTVHEAAAALRVSEATIYRWAAAGTLPSTKIGGTVRLRGPEVLALVSRTCHPEETP